MELVECPLFRIEKGFFLLRFILRKWVAKKCINQKVQQFFFFLGGGAYKKVLCHSAWPDFLFEGLVLLPHRQIKYPVDFDDELKIGDVRYDKMTSITIKVQLFWRLPFEM